MQPQPPHVDPEICHEESLWDTINALTTNVNNMQDRMSEQSKPTSKVVTQFGRIHNDVDEIKPLSEHEFSMAYWSDDDDEESESDVIECENPSSPRIYDDNLLDLGKDGIQGEFMSEHEDSSPFEVHGNRLFDSYNEESESDIVECEQEFTCTLSSQMNRLFNDSPCIDDNISLIDV